MVVEFEVGSEAFAADGAEIEGHAVVGVAMVAKCIEPSERFSTSRFAAFVGFFTSVDAFMAFESGKRTSDMKFWLGWEKVGRNVH